MGQIVYYVYILQSLADSNRYYTGFTRNLRTRLVSHNHGQVVYTSRYKPWRIKTYGASTNKQQALEFERYLKKPAGRAFAKKRL